MARTLTVARSLGRPPFLFGSRPPGNLWRDDMSAQVKQFPKKLKRSERSRDPETHALWVKYDRIGNELRDMAQELGVIYWAAFGLSEIISDGDHLLGIQNIAGRLQSKLEEFADEVRL